MFDVLVKVFGAVLMCSSLHFIGDEITIRGFLWGIPSTGAVACLGVGIYGAFSGWWAWVSAGLILAGIGLVLLNSRVWVDFISLKDLFIALCLLLGGFRLITLPQD